MRPFFHPNPHHEMAPASSFLIYGVFCLSDGSRMTNPSYYTEYLSALDLIDPNQPINISIRKYTPPSEPLYADGTIVFLVAKAALPANEDGILDVVHCTPFELSWEDFKDCLPSGPIHAASVTGTIGAIGNAGPTRSFTVNASEYVRDEHRVFPIQFVFPSDFDHTLSLISLNLGFSSKRIQVAGKTFVCRPLDLQSLPLACSRELLIRSTAKQF